MYKNYFITAFRNFLRNKSFSFIHILGLSIGISASLVIFLIVYHEYSFDRFEEKRENIYRVVMDIDMGINSGKTSAVPAPLGDAVAHEITGIDKIVPLFRFQGDASAEVSVTREKQAEPVVFKKQQNVVFVNADYFGMIKYKWLAGNAEMGKPFGVVLTESKAQRYFPGIENPEIVGREILYNKDLRTTVVGVVADLNEKTVFNGEEFISIATISETALQKNFMMNVWDDWMAYAQLYVRIDDGKKVSEIESQIQSMYKKYTKANTSDFIKAIKFRLQPLSDIHFNAGYPSIGARVADRKILFGLLAVAGFLLLLGCINFINLATAQGAQRAKEIGIRKTMGSSRAQLVSQFLSETLLITCLATVLSLIITPLLLKVFSGFIPDGVKMDFLKQPSLIAFMVLLSLVVSFLSGIYPALLLSGFNPVRVLKNQTYPGANGTRSSWIRKSLTVTQFFIAQFFIIATLLVGKQISYSINADLGFRKHAIITLGLPRDTTDVKNDKLINDIRLMSEVETVSSGFMSPADQGVAFANIQFKGKEELKANIQLRFGDSNYLKVYDLHLLAGRNPRTTEKFSEFLINETYAKMLGFQKPGDAINRELIFNGESLPIVGVMKDFHAQSMRSPVDPLVFAGGKGPTLHIRLKSSGSGLERYKKSVERISNAYGAVHPDSEFNYAFVDETVANFYKQDRDMSRLLVWATGLMILISCLGLLGLVIYTTNRRTKEIGVRKILGASVIQIVSTLSGDFVKLVLLAFVIAAPVAAWAMHYWLEGFAFRTTMSWWVFAATASLILTFALLTLSIRVWKAALSNPARSLRTE
ncbi:MAG: ABC transporter permease, partial [Gemmatimonadaceae bacterium]|nr:ABC transporter permease [Chitinophagaceae bacterium]